MLPTHHSLCTVDINHNCYPHTINITPNGMYDNCYNLTGLPAKLKTVETELTTTTKLLEETKDRLEHQTALASQRDTEIGSLNKILRSTKEDLQQKNIALRQEKEITHKLTEDGKAYRFKILSLEEDLQYCKDRERLRKDGLLPKVIQHNYHICNNI